MKIDPDKHFPLAELVNDERLLELAVTHFIHPDSEEEEKEIAIDIIHWYILRQHQINQTEFTEDSLSEEFNEICSAKILDGLIQKGIMEVDLEAGPEPIYRLTPFGAEVAEKLKG